MTEPICTKCGKRPRMATLPVCFDCLSETMVRPRPYASPCRIASTVAREIEARAVVGLGKYGVTVADSPLSRAEWLQHAYEEACDLAVYLRRLIEMEGGT